VEITRRTRAAAKNEPAAVGQPAPQPKKEIRRADEIPAGKINLIRASYSAGLKPPAIARTLRISQSLVRRVLGSPEKPKG
jgi:DNA invertase Pin-like site-specific DNA recombinase